MLTWCNECCLNGCWLKTSTPQTKKVASVRASAHRYKKDTNQLVKNDNVGKSNQFVKKTIFEFPKQEKYDSSKERRQGRCSVGTLRLHLKNTLILKNMFLST